jgi:hypothetical protein
MKINDLLCSIIILLATTSSLAQPNRDCRVLPPFLSKTGLDIKTTALSTSERKTMGLVAIEINTKPGTTPKSYQDPTWKNAGWLGPMVITDKGDVWVAPVPVINTEKNKPAEQNRIWKVDAVSGNMAVAVELPVPPNDPEHQNPYGLLGLGYDCDNGVLYASSVAGSTLNSEMGVLYAVQATTKKTIATIDSLDAFGVGIGTIDGVKRLYFGKARIGAIYSVGLNPDGSFSDNPRLELSLDNLGPRGDDRARKIRFAPDGTMTITGIEFYFNLTAPTEKQETVYQFRYVPAQQKWMLTGLQ